MKQVTFLLAVTVLAGLSLSAFTQEIPQYKRSYFSGWIDADRDCQNTRQEVLIEESLIPAIMDKTNCKVIAGYWVDPYSGQFTTNPLDLDIDHMVPLQEAWESGAYAWTKKERVVYANDLSNPNHLIAVMSFANRSKGAKDPASWMPSNVTYWKEYLLNWSEIKSLNGLTLDEDELAAFEYLLEIESRSAKGFKFRSIEHVKAVNTAVIK